MELTSVRVLAITVFFLAAIPRSGIKIGPLPIYFIDALLLISFYLSRKALKTRQVQRPPHYNIVMMILIIAITSELVTAIALGSFLEPIYTIVRTMLAFSIFLSLSRIIVTQEDLLVVAKAASLGIFITSLLMVLSSLAATRELVSPVFSIPMLNPNYESTITRMKMYSDFGISMRGTSLVGVSILSGAFILAIWPYTIYLYIRTSFKGFWRYLIGVTVLLAPFAILFSYSRGSILGLVLVLVVMSILSQGKTRRLIIASTILVVTTISIVGWNSSLFSFNRVSQRIDAMINNPYEDVRESERILSYIEPFSHVFEKPWFLMFGEGTTIGRLTPHSEVGSAANHSVFAQAYYSYGMAVSVCYLLLFFLSLRYAYRTSILYSRNKNSYIIKLISQASIFSMVGISPWVAFGHAAVSTPRGATLLFLVLGMVGVIRNLAIEQEKIDK